MLDEPTRVHLIAAKYHGATEHKPGRVSLTSYRFNDRIMESFNHDHNSAADQAREMLKAKGYTILTDGEAPGLAALFGVKEFVPVTKMTPRLAPDGQPLPRKVHIAARIYCRAPRSGGGVYHTADVYADGEPVGKTNPSYGSESVAEDNGVRLLENLGRIPKREHYENGSRKPVYQHFQELEIEYTKDVREVTRERDL